MAKTYVLKDNFYQPRNDSDVRNIIECNKGQIEAFKQIVGKRIHGLHKEYPGLLLFTSSNVDNSDDPEIIKGIDDLGEKKYRVYTSNVMGFLDVKKDDGKQLFQLKITSRFAQEDGEDYFLQYMLYHVMGINVFSDISFSSSNSIKAFDFLMLMFPSRLKAAYAQGLFREYQTFRHNDANVRGVIDVSRHIRQNTPFKGKVAYNTREFTRDNPLMQLIRHTIECIESRKYGRDILRSDQDIRAAVDTVRQYTPRYSSTDRVQVIADNLRPVVHPYYTAYSRLQELCLRILRYEKVAYGTAKDTINGILFDGAWLWEEYLDILLRRLNFFHPKNKESLGALQLFEDDINLPYNRNMYPDFFSEERECVLDAKYKHVDYGIQRNDLYQVIAYMHTMKYKVGGYLYPYSKQTDSDLDSQKNQTFKLVNDTGVLYTIPFNVPQRCKDWAEFCTQMHNEEESFLSRVKNPEG